MLDTLSFLIEISFQKATKMQVWTNGKPLLLQYRQTKT